MSSETSFLPLYIDGGARPAKSGATFTVRTPGTQRAATIAVAADPSDVDAAIDSAQAAFPAWAALPPSARAGILLRAAALMEEPQWGADVQAALLHETGTTKDWRDMQVYATPAYLKSMCGCIGEIKGESFPSMIPGGQAVVQRVPLGVIHSIVPWNASVLLVVRNLAVALLCGNTIVCRPSEYSPRSSWLAVEAMEKAGLPPGVLNFVTMAREDIPALTKQIIAHPSIRKIAFTGSQQVGRILATEAGKYLKPCVLELGSKSTIIQQVLPDADINAAARGILYSGVANAGQVCTSTERVIVHKDVYPALLDALKTRLPALRTGHAEKDDSNVIGTLVPDGAADNVRGMVREALDGGAKILAGGVDGHDTVLKPTLVGGVKPGMRLWDHETFGPVMVIAVAETTEEAIRLANSTEYSLNSSLWCSDIYAAMEVTSQLKAGEFGSEPAQPFDIMTSCVQGTVNINGPTVHFELQHDMRGLGDASGYGAFDVESFTHKKMVVLHKLERTYPLPV